jgi:transcriptional regulator with XRE-family HTH domain
MNTKENFSGIASLRKLFVRLRKQKGYSQEYIALKLAISQAAYSKFEKGKSSLSSENLLTLFELYNADVRQVLEKELED